VDNRPERINPNSREESAAQKVQEMFLIRMRQEEAPLHPWAPSLRLLRLIAATHRWSKYRKSLPASRQQRCAPHPIRVVRVLRGQTSRFRGAARRRPGNSVRQISHTVPSQPRAVQCPRP